MRSLSKLFILCVMVASFGPARAADQPQKQDQTIRLIVGLDSDTAKIDENLLQITKHAQSLKDLGGIYKEVVVYSRQEISAGIRENYQGLKEDLKMDLQIAKPYPKGLIMKTVVITYEHLRFLVLEVPFQSLGVLVGIGTEVLFPMMEVTTGVSTLVRTELFSLASQSIRFLNLNGYNLKNLKQIIFLTRNSAQVLKIYGRTCSGALRN